jgi:hypothetical protein
LPITLRNLEPDAANGTAAKLRWLRLSDDAESSTGKTPAQVRQPALCAQCRRNNPTRAGRAC